MRPYDPGVAAASSRSPKRAQKSVSRKTKASCVVLGQRAQNNSCAIQGLFVVGNRQWDLLLVATGTGAIVASISAPVVLGPGCRIGVPGETGG